MVPVPIRVPVCGVTNPTRFYRFLSIEDFPGLSTSVVVAVVAVVVVVVAVVAAVVVVVVGGVADGGIFHVPVKRGPGPAVEPESGV